MSEVCNDDISGCELLGRILNETSQINKQGRIKDKAMYPKLSFPDRESGREGLFSNKLSVVRLCRGHNNLVYSWQIHRDIAEGFVAKSDNVFRGFLFAPAFIIKQYDLKIVPDGNVKNPYHAHIIIPDFNVGYTSDSTAASDVIPSHIKRRLDRLRMRMRAVILNPGPKYPMTLNYASPSDSICNLCPIS